jgi:glycosyltransferase involved in cell wall biosynthesis
MLEEYVMLQDFKNVTYYSFWTDDWATALSILKKRKIINYFVSRVHGYDLYKERWRLGIIPFRYFQLEQVTKIFAVSSDGLNYMRNLYPSYQHKFKLSHLNVFDNGMNPWDEASVFTIVSCSNLIPLKRIGLIIEALKYVNFELRWIHFGDGELRQVLQEQIKHLPKNINVSFKGDVPNSYVIEFYKTHSINLFIHMSETEGGVPLALQEAASFGIPLIGAQVGGVAEIVSEKTGVLTKIDITAEELGNLIGIFKNSQMNTKEFRYAVKQYWKKSFDATVNYKDLYNKIVIDYNESH